MEQKPDSPSFEELLDNYLPKNKDIRESDPPPPRIQSGKHTILDLHGMTLRSAEEALRRQIRDAVSNDISTIRVITGKGLHSPDGRAVLRENIRKGLNDGRFGRVRSFRQGKAAEGGSGVFILTL